MKVLCFVLAAATLAAAAPHRTLAGCTLGRVTTLPVTMAGMKALVPAQINGTDAQFVLDSGAFFSTMTPAGAAEYKLHTGPAPRGLRIVGIGGSARTSVTNVSVFTLAGVRFTNLDFIVGGGEVGDGAVGTIGQNILRLVDVEYDLANGVVTLWKPKDCRKTTLAYWAQSQPYSDIKIQGTSVTMPHTIASAALNGEDIRVLFDSGAAQSLITLRAAERAGFKPDGPGARATGLVRGIGAEAVQGWIGTFSLFQIGGEQIRNAQLHVADTRLPDADMLLGADFFLSHRIYVAISQDRLYMTYNGGPVFSLGSPPPRPGNATPAQSGTQTAETAAEPTAEPTDAAGFSRRGAAFAARRDFLHAIADLTRACELDPMSEQYFYQRAEAYLGNRQPALALADLNRALQLAPSDVQALTVRAALRLDRHDAAGAGADLDAADRFAPKQADIRLNIASLDTRAGRFAPAVAQFDLWIDSHADDSRKPDALNGRCWARALGRKDLKKALSDCTLALRLRPDFPAFLDSRALVEQRLGAFAKSIEDEDAALRAQPKNAWFLYLRGVSELRAGRKAPGRADIAAAVDLQPHIVDLGRERGVTP